MLTRFLLLAAFLLSLSTAPLKAMIGVLVFAVLCLGISFVVPSAEKRSRLMGTLLGTATPLLPVLGSGGLLAAVWLYLLLNAQVCCRSSIAWMAPLGWVLSLWAGALLIFNFDAAVWLILWHGEDGPGAAGVLNILRFLRSAPPDYILVLLWLARFLMTPLIFGHFCVAANARQGYWDGLMIGLFAAALLSILQIGVGIPIGNFNPYWRELGRFPGSFSDPNAFGVFIVLALPLMLVWNRRAKANWYALVLAMVWLGLGLFSGSRSFFAGLALHLLFVETHLRRRHIQVLFCLAAASVCMLIFWRVELREATAIYLKILPVGLQRLIDTLTAEDLQRPLYSRIQFAKAAWLMWLNHPFFGVGLEQFRANLLWYSAAAHSHLGTWSDNPNNFYLGMLAQTGLTGFAALLWSLTRLSVKRLDPHAAKADQAPTRACLSSLFCLVILLFLGPHLEFDEIAVLTGFLMGCSLEPKVISQPLLPYNSSQNCIRRCLVKITIEKLWMWFGILLAPFILFAAAHTQTGLYPWESGPDGFFRWTTLRARVSLTCPAGQQQRRVSFKALTPEINTLPVDLVLRQGEVIQRLSLRDHKPLSLWLACQAARMVPSGNNEARFEVQLSRAWTPLKYGFSADSRLLGIQVIGD